jgi:hypothetical protein
MSLPAWEGSFLCTVQCYDFLQFPDLEIAKGNITESFLSVKTIMLSTGI